MPAPAPQAPLPQPLARMRRLLHRDGLEMRGLHAVAFATIEALVRWHGLVLLSARSRQGLPVDRLHRVQTFFRRPSFGSWVEILLRHGVRDEGDGAGELAGLLAGLRTLLTEERQEHGELLAAMKDEGSTGPCAVTQLLEKLPSYRNNFIGHAGYLSDEHYDRLAPAFRRSAEALLVQTEQAAHRLQVVAARGAELRLIDLDGADPRDLGAVDEPPEITGAEVCFLVDERAGPLLPLGELTTYESGRANLFDRVPKPGRCEFIDFATGDRVRRDSIALADSEFVHNLSVEAAEGGEGALVKGRRAVRVECLRHTARVGEPVPFRVVLRNQGPVDLEASIEIPETVGWLPIDGEDGASRVVPAGGFGSWLRSFEPQHSGVLTPPSFVVTTSYDAQGDAEPLQADGPVRVKEALGGTWSSQQPLIERLTGGPLDPSRSAGAVALIAGASGSQKSATLKRAQERARRIGTREISGSFRGAGGQPYKAFQDLLRDLLALTGHPVGDPKLRQEAAERLGEHLGEDTPSIAFFVEELLGEATQVAEGMRHYRWFRLLEACSRENPLLLVVDDVREADEDSLLLLGGLLERCQQEQLPIAFLGALGVEEGEKPQLPEALAEVPGAEMIELAPLESPAIEEMITALYPGVPFRDDLPWLADAVCERSAGNAAFALDIARSLGRPDDGLFQIGGEGQWQIIDTPSREVFLSELPAHRSEAIAGFYQRVEEEQRPVLDYAALIDGVVPVAVLERLIDDADLLDDALDHLEKEGMIEAIDTDLTLYRFESQTVATLIREQVDGGGRRLAMRKRRHLAGALIEEFGDAPAHAESIGRLLLAAGKGEESVEHLLRALERREKQGNYALAGELIELIEGAAGEVGLTDEMALPFQLCAGRVLQLLGRGKAGLERFEKALELAETRSDDEQRLRALLGISNHHQHRSEWQRALELLAEELIVAESLGIPDLVRTIRSNTGAALTNVGDFEEAIAQFEAGLAVDDPGDDGRGRADLLTNLGFLHNAAGRYAESTRLGREAAEIYEGIGDLNRATIARVNATFFLFWEGRLAEAGEVFRGAIETFRQLQQRRGLGRNHRNLAQVEELLGRHDVALESLERAVEIRARLQHRGEEAQSRLDLARLYALTGDWPESEAQVQLAHQLASAGGIEVLLREAEVRADLNHLSAGGNPDEIDLERYFQGEDLPDELQVLVGVLQCRVLERRRERLGETSFEALTTLLERFDSLPEGIHRCLLAASIANAAPDRARALEIIERTLALVEETPPGAPIDMVMDARARISEGDEKDEWARRALESVEEQARRIHDPEIRKRFLKARLGRLD